MKKFLLSVFILLSIQLYSQINFRFADSTAQWITLEHTIATGSEHYFTNEFYIGGKHTIYGRTYQDVSYSGLTAFYIRKDSLNKVWLLKSSDTLENLIYDFGLNKNDTVRIYDQIANSYSIVCHVDSIDSVNIGHYRKRMFMSCGKYLDELYHPDVWIDEVGSLYSYLINPGSDSIYQGGLLWLETLLCFYEHNQLVYSNPNYNYCEIDTIIFAGVRNISPSNSISIFPNPASSFLTIQSENNFPEQTSFQLFDLTGRMVSQKQLTQKNTQLDVSGMSKGMYLYNIFSSKQKLGSGKLAIQ